MMLQGSEGGTGQRAEPTPVGPEARPHQRHNAEQTAKARRLLADAEAYATSAVAAAIADNGLEAAQYQVALKQVEALSAVSQKQGNQTILVPTAALEAFGDAFKLLKGKS